jgi:hypothetical protein
MLYALPTLTEQTFSSYISANYSGTYSVSPSFTAQDYQLPLILVKAGRFKEIEPGTDVYEGDLAISIQTQVDDVTNPVGTHDLTVAMVYDLMTNQSGVFSAVNPPSGSGAFHLFGFYNAGYDQDRIDRALVSILDYKINCQTLAIGN